MLNELSGGHGPRSGDEALLPWVESLPFPLASIAWYYLAETDPPAKVDYLLRFFEALAQFTATIQLSAYISDGEFFDANRDAWFGSGPGGRGVIDLRRATFGAWAELAERLAVTGRRILAGHDSEAARYLRLFGASDAGMVDALTSPELNKILLHARDCRNSWTGHGGVASTQLHKERLHDLEELLARTQDILAWSFETWTLLQPGPMTLSRGTFNLVATVLTGTNPAFRKRQFQLGQALDSDHLYFLNDGSPTAMELIPLIRIIAGTESGQDACYFFNRVEGPRVRWVSYHNRSEPEVLMLDEDVTQLLTSLIPHPT